MFLIKAKGGLGNRMLSTASGILYALGTEREFVIDWTDGIYANTGTNAYPKMFKGDSYSSLQDITDNVADLNVVPSIWANQLRNSPSEMIARYFPSQHSNPFVYRKLSAPLSAHYKAGDLEVFWAYTSKMGRIKPFLGKSSGSVVKLMREVLKDYFSPCEEVQRELNKTLLGKNNSCLGVHIRYTDLKVPLDGVIKKIKKCIQEQQYSKIFLATDSQYVEEVMKSTFNDVLTSKKRFASDTGQLHTNTPHENKLQDSHAALFDMYALAQCDGLVYSSRSSFSRVSYIVGEFDRYNSFDVDQFNPIVKAKCFIQEYL